IPVTTYPEYGPEFLKELTVFELQQAVSITHRDQVVYVGDIALSHPALTTAYRWNMHGYMTDRGDGTVEVDLEVDRKSAGPALALSAALAGRMSKEKMQKIHAVHRLHRKSDNTDHAIVKIQVTPEGKPLEFIEPFNEFPSETMLAQIMLVV